MFCLHDLISVWEVVMVIFRTNDVSLRRSALFDAQGICMCACVFSHNPKLLMNIDRFFELVRNSKIDH